MTNLNRYANLEAKIRYKLTEAEKEATEKQLKSIREMRDLINFANKTINEQQKMIKALTEHIDKIGHEMRNQTRNAESWQQMAKIYHEKLKNEGFETAHLSYIKL